jgi:cobalt-zinc-cadmium efflux system protein
MGDGHVHDGAVHGRASDGSDRRLLVAALVLLVAFMAFEVGAAVFANSLALLADAGHMLVDIGAIACSLLALNLAARPETGSHTYGLKRAEILAAAGNALALLVVAALVTFEAVGRLLRPEAVDGAVLIVVATVGVVLMLWAAVQLLRPAVRILLEATPEDIDLEEVRRHLVELPEVESVHDLHAWTLTSSLPILTAHVVVTDECFSSGDAGRVLDHLQDCLSGHFDVAHSTLQFESAGHLDHELGSHA